MGRRRERATVILGWLALSAIGWPVGAAGAELSPLACSADRPSVALGGTVALHAWAGSASGRLTYSWAATAGRLEGHGAEARWSLADLRPGAYAATVNVRSGDGPATECVVRILVRRDARGRGMPSPPVAAPTSPSRETGRSLLLPGRSEESGYGLYSYFLLGAPPSEAARDRYLKALESFMTLIPDIAGLEEYVERRELNIAYVPVRAAPAQAPSATWALDNFDYARARVLLRNLPRPNREGPYLLAALKPLASAGAQGPYLLQDLSAVPPHLAASWVREFLNQAAQERFWEERTTVRLASRLRMTIGILGAGLPEVRNGVNDWIAWVR